MNRIRGLVPLVLEITNRAGRPSDLRAIAEVVSNLPIFDTPTDMVFDHLYAELVAHRRKTSPAEDSEEKVVIIDVRMPCTGLAQIP